MANDSNQNAATDAPGQKEVELLSFYVGDHEYSVDIMSVREIRGWTKTTSLPHSPPFVRGVINLRGRIVPIDGGAIHIAFGQANHFAALEVDSREDNHFGSHSRKRSSVASP